MAFIDKVRELCSPLTMECLEKTFKLIITYDNIYTVWSNEPPNYLHGRVFIQIKFNALCTHYKDEEKEWKGRKFYLSEFMTDDEIIKTVWVAFKMCIEHEVMEGFKYAGKIIFNPHVPYTELITLTDKEIQRTHL